MTPREMLEAASWGRIYYEPQTAGSDCPPDRDCPVCDGTGATEWWTSVEEGRHSGRFCVAVPDDVCVCLARWRADAVCDHVAADDECRCDRAHRCGGLLCYSAEGDWQPRTSCVPCGQAASALSRAAQKEGSPCV